MFVEKTINQKNNKIVYPFQQLMAIIVHYLLVVVKAIIPCKYKEHISIIETNSTFNNILGLSFFNALGGLVMMLTNIKVANMLGASLFGLYSYYLAIGEVGQNFVRYGRNKTMTRDLIQNPNKFDSLISNTFVLGLVNIIIFSISILLFAKPLDVEITFASILLFISPCLGSIDFQPVYESLRQMSWHSVYLLIQRLLFLLAIWLWIFLVGSPSLLYLGITFFFSWLWIVILQFKEIVIGFNINLKRDVSLKSIVSLYKSNFLIALSCMAGVAFGPIIRMILKGYVSNQAVGVYSAGMQIFLLSQFLMHQVSRVGNPIMAEAGKPDVNSAKRRSLCRKYLLIMFSVVVPFAAILFVFPNSITKFCFTSEYSALGDYLPLFGIYLLALALGIVFTQFLISIHKEKTYFIIYITTALITLFVSFWLIPIFGLLGAIIALCIPHSIGCLFYYFCSIKYLRQ